MSINIKETENGFKAIVGYKNALGLWRKTQKAGFFTEEEAKKWASAKEEELNKKPTNYTLIDLINLYFGTKNLKEKSKTALLEMYESLTDELKEKNITDITEEDTKMWFLVSTKITGTTYEVYAKKLKTMFNFAKSLGLITYIPLNAVQEIMNKPREKKNNMHGFIEKEKYLSMINNIKSEEKRLFIVLLYNTGIRISEALGLYLKDITKEFIYVKNQIDDHKNDATLKSKSSYRKIPINEQLYNYIHSVKRTNEEGYVFDHRSRRLYTKLCSDFGVTSHSFRHTFCSRFIHKKIDITILSKVVGDNINTIYNRYLEVNKDANKKEEFKKIKFI